MTHALISVYDKEGIVDFAKGLVEANISLISTGGTASLLKQHQIPVEEVSDFTGFEEMFEGRVKTLHPKIYAGILARGAQDNETLIKHQIPRIGLVVVNLYPFEKVVSSPHCSLETAIENIDIGGPTLLRSAAKNHALVTAIVDKADYHQVLTEIKTLGNTTQATRLTLAKKVFLQITKYDSAISNYFSSLSQVENPFPDIYCLCLTKKCDLRYGENPHQAAAFYVPTGEESSILNHAKQHSGKPLSYNNMIDADAAFECVRQFKQIACVIVKHTNPCGVSLATSQFDAYKKAFNADPTSAFGGIIAFNTPLETATLQAILENQFVEVIIAPECKQTDLTLLQQKPNIRLLTVPIHSNATERIFEFKSIQTGLLVQEKDNLPLPQNFEVVTEKRPTDQESKDLLFAWQVVRFVKSNAIVLAKEEVTIGIGPGQTSRIFSSKIAYQKAKEGNNPVPGAVLASDAFFPFRDSIDEAAAMGISAIIQPGGSIRDKEIIEAANQHQVAMLFTHRRHFRH